MSYIFDSATDPTERQRKKRLAEALMMKATDAGPIASPWQGAAKMAQALMGGIELGQYDKQDREDRDWQNKNTEMMRGGGVPTVADGSAPTSAVAAALGPKLPTFAQTGGKMADVGDPVASDLSPVHKAVLNAIAAPESGGRYNVRYTPQGGATFTDLSTHPNVLEPTKDGKRSSAAGRYQFTGTTWNSLGGGSFDPASQDMKAIELARRDYKARTGRDFDGDLAQGGLSPQIMQALAPTWHGLKDNPQRALAAYQSSIKKYGLPSGANGPAPTDLVEGGSGQPTMVGGDTLQSPQAAGGGVPAGPAMAPQAAPRPAGLMATGSGQAAAPGITGQQNYLLSIIGDRRSTPQMKAEAQARLQLLQKDESVSTVDLGTQVGVMDKKGNIVRTYPKQQDPQAVRERELTIKGKERDLNDVDRLTAPDGQVWERPKGQPDAQWKPVLKLSEKPQAVTFGEVGTDPATGSPIRGFINPNDKTVSQYKVMPDPNAPAPPPDAVPPPGVDPKAWREGYTKNTQASTLAATPDEVAKLRGEVQGLPSYKNYAQAAPIYRSMFKAAGTDSKASDLNLVYGLGKIMDPGSVVREGEMVMVKNTAGLPEWFTGLVNGLNGGQALTPETRQAIMKEAHVRLQAYQEQFQQEADFYKNIATKRRADPDQVIPNFGQFDPWAPAPKAPMSTGATPAPSPYTPDQIEAEMRKRGHLK